MQLDGYNPWDMLGIVIICVYKNKTTLFQGLKLIFKFKEANCLICTKTFIYR